MWLVLRHDLSSYPNKRNQQTASTNSSILYMKANWEKSPWWIMATMHREALKKGLVTTPVVSLWKGKFDHETQEPISSTHDNCGSYKQNWSSMLQKCLTRVRSWMSDKNLVMRWWCYRYGGIVKLAWIFKCVDASVAKISSRLQAPRAPLGRITAFCHKPNRFQVRGRKRIPSAHQSSPWQKFKHVYKDVCL